MSSLKEVVEVRGVGSRPTWEGGVDGVPGSFDSTQRGRNKRSCIKISKEQLLPTKKRTACSYTLPT